MHKQSHLLTFKMHFKLQGHFGHHRPGFTQATAGGSSPNFHQSASIGYYPPMYYPPPVPYPAPAPAHSYPYHAYYPGYYQPPAPAPASQPGAYPPYYRGSNRSAKLTVSRVFVFIHFIGLSESFQKTSK